MKTPKTASAASLIDGIRCGSAVLLLVIAAVYPHPAIADTIYLTNGRIIHTEDVRIEGDLVIFRQLGGEVSIPRSAVARIVEDDEVEQPTVRPAGPAESSPEVGVDEARGGEGAPGGDGGGSEGAPGGDGGEGAPGGDPTAASSGARDDDVPDLSPDPGNPGAVDDPSAAAYWVAQIVSVDERIARAEAELERLPRYDAADRRLLRFSGQARYFMEERDRWEEMLRNFEETRRQIMDGARRAGITPGALRDGLERARGGTRPEAGGAFR